MGDEVKPQRIRDPLHDIVAFDEGELERVLWKVIQTRPFQRLRRIKQLGFADLVYPGATHTRFAHSIGVFHTARLLMNVICALMPKNAFQETRAHQALAAALLHDVGHGMFSHAFEKIGHAKNLRMARHESVSQALITDSEISKHLEILGGGFPKDVATLVAGSSPRSLYGAVVSSQFDADRLDYMRRDRMMTGVGIGGIDFSWLLNNLEMGEVATGVDDDEGERVKTFVLGPKASLAAEAYVHALFLLYPTVYFHKAIRAAEVLFSGLMNRVIDMLFEDDLAGTGLQPNHPIARFAKNPDSLDLAIALDDTVFWGALPMLAESDDELLSRYAIRIRDRKLHKCIDVRPLVESAIVDRLGKAAPSGQDYDRLLTRLMAVIREKLEDWSNQHSTTVPRIIVDSGKRAPYKTFQESESPLNQVRIRRQDGRIVDIAENSPALSALKTFEFFRAYHDHGDSDARDEILRIVKDATWEVRHDDPN